MTTDRRTELQENLFSVEKMLVWQKEMTSKDFAEEYVYLPKTNAIETLLRSMYIFQKQTPLEQVSQWTSSIVLIL